VIRKWRYVVVPGIAVAGYILHSVQENRVEQELYEEAMFQQMVEQRKRMNTSETNKKST
jgi:hypothetical protein